MFTAIHKEISVFAKSGIAHIPCHDGKVITCGECLGRRSVNVQRLGILRLVLRDGQIPDKKNDCGYQDQKNDEDGEGKAAQTKQLRELLQEEAEKGNYVIAGGDFNQAFSNYDNSAYPLVSEDMWTPGVIDVDEFGDNLTFVTDNSTPSCRSLDRPLAGNDSDPSVFQYYMIDGFIVSDNLTINTVETRDLGFKNSDHNPIVMNVTVTK